MSDRLSSLRNSSEFAEERLVARAQSLLHECMIRRGLTRTDLAEKMGVSKARVSQIFSDNQNFTLRLIANAFHALGMQVTLDLLSEEKAELSIETKSYKPERDYLIDDLISYVLADDIGAGWISEQIVRRAHEDSRRSWELHSGLKGKIENLRLTEHPPKGIDQESMSTWMGSNVISIEKKKREYARAC